MMQLQSDFYIYGSQVGLSYETGEPIAVSVPTTYRPNFITEVAEGALIVCDKTN